MCFPERLENFLIRNLFRVIFDLDDLRMAGLAGADLFVTGIFFVAAGISAGDRFHPGQHLINGLSAPETTTAKSSDFRLVRWTVHRFVLSEGGESATQQQPEAYQKTNRRGNHTFYLAD